MRVKLLKKIRKRFTVIGYKTVGELKFVRVIDHEQKHERQILITQFFEEAIGESRLHELRYKQLVKRYKNKTK